MKRTATQWAIAIRDCGVLRVRFDDLVLIEGIEDDWIDAQPVDDDEDALDVRLKPKAINWLNEIASASPACDSAGLVRPQEAGSARTPIPAENRKA